MMVIDGIIMKGRHVIIPKVFKKLALDQLHLSHVGIEKTKLLAWESVYWININDDIENHIKNCTTCLTYQQTQSIDKIDKILMTRKEAIKPEDIQITYSRRPNLKDIPIKGTLEDSQQPRGTTPCGKTRCKT